MSLFVCMSRLRLSDNNALNDPHWVRTQTENGVRFTMRIHEFHLYRVGLIIMFVAMVLPPSTSGTTLERWSNCTMTKDLWPNSARWSSSTSNSSSKIPLYIAGFLPFSDKFFDQLVCTVLMAVEHVNDDPNLLPDYELRLIWNWTQVGSVPFNGRWG